MQFWSVLAVLLDGARADVLESMARAGELPTMKDLFFDAGGFATATSVFPTVSGPAHLPLLSGVHPGSANLPGIRWAERPTGKRGIFLGRTRSYMAPGRARKLQRDVPSGLKALFSHVPNMADVNTWFVRGCPGPARRTRWSKPLSFGRALVTGNWHRSEDQAERAVIGALQAGFTSVHAVFPAIDELGHRFGPLSEPSFEAYRGFDRALARIRDALTRQGTADETLIVVSSDHGQTATHTHVDADAVVRKVYPRTLAYPEIWRHPFSAQAAVMVSGNSMANVYVQGAGGWDARPDFAASDSQAQELLESLIQHSAIEHVLYRDREPGVYVVANPQGRLRIATRQDENGWRLRLDVQGQDPFGYGAFARQALWRTPDELAALTADSEYPDAPWQIVQFFGSPRAGDLVINARHGFDLRARFEYQPHNGSHGGLHRDHMLVPALVNAAWPCRRLRTVDLFPTILRTLGSPVPSGLDGVPHELGDARPLELRSLHCGDGRAARKEGSGAERAIHGDGPQPQRDVHDDTDERIQAEEPRNKKRSSL